MKELLIACDLDGVVADFDGTWPRFYNEDFEPEVPLKPRTQHTYHALHDETHFETVEEWWAWFHVAVGFGNLDPVAGAISGVRQMIHDHAVFFVTARQRWTQADTMQWLQAHGIVAPVIHTPDLPKAKMMFERLEFYPDLWIEDNPHEIEEILDFDARADVIVFDMPWNQGVTVPRAIDWERLLTMVNKKAKE